MKCIKYQNTKYTNYRLLTLLWVYLVLRLAEVVFRLREYYFVVVPRRDKEQNFRIKFRAERNQYVIIKLKTGNTVNTLGKYALTQHRT